MSSPIHESRPRRHHEHNSKARYTESQDYLAQDYRSHDHRSAHDQELIPRDPRSAEMPMEPYYEGDSHRPRSVDRDYYEDHDEGNRSDDYERSVGRYVQDRSHRPRKTSSRYDDDERSRRRVMTKEKKIMAALAGAAILAGGKELYDRYEAKEEQSSIQRNPLASAALGVAGALAGYQSAETYSKKVSSKRAVKYHGRDYESDYYSDESSGDDERDKKHNHSFLESAMATAGISKVVKSLTQGGGDDRSESSYRSSSRRSRRSRRRGSNASDDPGYDVEKIQRNAMAALLAGASEAFRLSKQPGSWKGEKTKRIVTAAATAGGINAAHDSKHKKLGLLQSIMGGLATNRVINGPKKDVEADEYGRSRSRSRAYSRSRSESRKRSKAAGPAAAIMGAIAGKKFLDRSRSRSRSRTRRDDSPEYYDDSQYDDGRGPKKSGARARSRSAVRKLMAKTSLGGSDDDSRYGSRRDDSRRGSNDEDDEYYHDEKSNRRKSRRHRHRQRDEDRDDSERSPSFSAGSRRDRDSYDSDEERSASDNAERRHKRKEKSHRRRDRG